MLEKSGEKLNNYFNKTEGFCRGRLNDCFNRTGSFFRGPLLIFVLVAMLVGFVVFDLDDLYGGRTDFLINLTMLVIIMFVFLWALMDPLHKVNNIRKQLMAAVDLINKDSKSGNGYLWDDYKNRREVFRFSEEGLLLSYKEFYDESKRVENDFSLHHVCDISDYLNHDLIDKEAKKNLLSIIPGFMTGLGILGTFVGLSFGLREFNITGETSEMVESIPPLIDGIKIAFHTSIYGMIASLAFNIAYKNALEAAYKAMGSFLETFFRYVCPNEGTYSQQRQSEAVVNQITKSVEKLTKTNELLFNEIHMLPQALIEGLKPEYETTHQSLQNFTENISKMQLEGIEELAKIILQRVDNSIAGNFNALNAIIEKTQELLTKESIHLNDLSGGVNKLSSNIKTINDETIKKLTDYISELDTILMSMNNYSGAINQHNAEIQRWLVRVQDSQDEIAKKESEYLDALTIEYRNISKMTAEFSNNVNMEIDQLNSMQEFLGVTAKKEIEEIAEHALNSAEILSNVVNNTFEKLIKITNSSAEYFSNGVNETFKELIEKTVSEFDKLSTSTSKANESIRNASVNNIEHIKKVAESFEKESIIEFKKTALDEIKKARDESLKAIDNISKTAKYQVEAVCDFSDKKTGDMSIASRTMGEATDTLNETLNKFNNQLQGSLSKTFSAFDEELSEITSKLSTTISRIENTTERVPEVVSKAWESMKESSDDMEKEMKAMIHMLDVMQRNMPDVVKRLLTDEELTEEEKKFYEKTTA